MPRGEVDIINESALVIEDFSALGQISMVSALTVLQAMNHTTAALPTAILSTQTEGFGTPKKLATNQWIKQTIKHWQLVPDIDFSGALVGYIGDTEIISMVEQLFTMKLGNRPVIIDPVMGDEGKLYPGLSKDYIQHVRRLCTHATIITPNWTELCFLSGAETVLEPSLKNAQHLLDCIQDFDINADVIITGTKLNDQTGCLFQSREEGFEFVGHSEIDGHFYGTGDTFAAVLLGCLLSNLSLTDSVKKATNLIYEAIVATANEQEVANRKYGLKLGKLIQLIVSQN